MYQFLEKYKKKEIQACCEQHKSTATFLHDSQGITVSNLKKNALDRTINELGLNYIECFLLVSLKFNSKYSRMSVQQNKKLQEWIINQASANISNYFFCKIENTQQKEETKVEQHQLVEMSKEEDEMANPDERNLYLGVFDKD